MNIDIFLIDMASQNILQTIKILEAVGYEEDSETIKSLTIIGFLLSRKVVMALEKDDTEAKNDT